MNAAAAGIAAIGFGILSGAATGAGAEDLFGDGRLANMASDQRAARVGDALTVVVYQSAEARNAAQNNSRRRRSLEGALHGGSTQESGGFSLDGGYAGQGEVRRSESFATQISVTIESVLPNGDYVIAGRQLMSVNGEQTTVQVRGRIRPVDITSDNQVLSTRIANAEISYDGRGFVSRSARPGLIDRLLSLLGLGG